MGTLVLKNLGKTYDVNEGGGKYSQIKALDDINLEIEEREFVSIIGPSGCGKSTLLMIIAGLIDSTAGSILLDGKAVKGPSLDRGVVFQEYALFPWMTVRNNVKFGMQMKGWSKDKQDEIAADLLREVGLAGFEDDFPHRLSGGMKQRVAVARALAYDPAVLLMDEPFGALDAQTRAKLQLVTTQIWEKTAKTILFVTHNVEEAVYLSDRVIVLSARPGRLYKDIKIDLPRPRSRLTEEFLWAQKEVALALAQVQGAEENEELAQLIGG